MMIKNSDDASFRGRSNRVENLFTTAMYDSSLPTTSGSRIVTSSFHSRSTASRRTSLDDRTRVSENGKMTTESRFVPTLSNSESATLPFTRPTITTADDIVVGAAANIAKPVANSGNSNTLSNWMRANAGTAVTTRMDAAPTTSALGDRIAFTISFVFNFKPEMRKMRTTQICEILMGLTLPTALPGAGTSAPNNTPTNRPMIKWYEMRNATTLSRRENFGGCNHTVHGNAHVIGRVRTHTTRHDAPWLFPQVSLFIKVSVSTPGSSPPPRIPAYAAFSPLIAWLCSICPCCALP